MERYTLTRATRRTFLRTCFTATAAFVLAACGRRAPSSITSAPTTTAQPPNQGSPTAPPSTQEAQVLRPTPACGDDDDDVTPAQTEGPYYMPSTPERTSLLEMGITGTKLVVTGYVLTTDCRPVVGALLDFWQADDGGAYDNVGYRLRGHQFTDEQGRYTLETILPGLYPGRTRHIHVKAQAPNQSVLTTQLYFPNEPRNTTDRIFHPDLAMDVQDAADGKVAAYTFVLPGG